MCGPTLDTEMENPQVPRHGPANTQVEKVNEEETLVVDEMQDEQGIRHQADNDEEPSKCHSCCHKLIDFYFTYGFLYS